MINPVVANALRVLSSPALAADLSLASLAVRQLMKEDNYPRLTEAPRREYVALLTGMQNGISKAKEGPTPAGAVSESDLKSLLGFWGWGGRYGETIGLSLPFASPEGTASVERMKEQVHKTENAVLGRAKALAGRREAALGAARQEPGLSSSPALGMSSQRLAMALPEMPAALQKETMERLAGNFTSLMERVAGEIENKNDEGVASALQTVEGLLDTLAVAEKSKKSGGSGFWAALRGSEAFREAWNRCVNGSVDVKGFNGFKTVAEEKIWTERLNRLDWNLKMGFFYETYSALASRDVSSSWKGRSFESDPLMAELPDRIKRCLSPDTVKKLFGKKWQEKLVADFQELDEALRRRASEEEIAGTATAHTINQCGTRFCTQMTETIRRLRRAKSETEGVGGSQQEDKENLRGLVSFMIQLMNSPFVSMVPFPSRLFLESFEPLFNLSFEDILSLSLQR